VRLVPAEPALVQPRDLNAAIYTWAIPARRAAADQANQPQARGSAARLGSFTYEDISKMKPVVLEQS